VQPHQADVGLVQLGELDDEDFYDFGDDEALDVSDEQCALLASFGTI
jgi:hypothetical protein